MYSGVWGLSCSQECAPLRIAATMRALHFTGLVMFLSVDRLTRSSIGLLVFMGFFIAEPTRAADVVHVLGTVTAIDSTHVEVKTAKGQIVSVLLNTQVQFKNKLNAKSAVPPEVGDRVIIEATKEKQKVMATIVHYSPMRNPSIPR